MTRKWAGHILTVHLLLRDRPGILSAVLTALPRREPIFLTVNQNIPAGGRPRCLFRPGTDRMSLPVEAFIKQLRTVDGVRRIERISGEGVG